MMLQLQRSKNFKTIYFPFFYSLLVSNYYIGLSCVRMLTYKIAVGIDDLRLKIKTVK